jgi:intermembrane space import and assembly protein 40
MEQAINPETGEINWDCPCMGNNPKGPCGELFKKAFECFVKNQNNPEVCSQTMITMQNCQSKYPLIYNENDNENDNDK